MPDIDANLQKWSDFNWRRRGAEWSHWWGDPQAQWRVTLAPRIKEFLPAPLLVEIAPGYGRWTQFLRRQCCQLVGVDLLEKCVEACRERFADDPLLSFYHTDGKTLVGVEDRTAEFVFSFDSLVHVEQDVMDGYLTELARTLAPDGVAFLHHSNMGAYPSAELVHWRGSSVSARSVAIAASERGLTCFRQELIPWGRKHPYFVDSLTWLARSGSRHDRPIELAENPTFMDEADRALVRTLRRRRYSRTNLLRWVKKPWR